ncbi:MAG: hypothetical protein HYV02_00050 [Deltaproteobacteria bacterium]|nr:hypothetical protein [Deltaproteobacteria bacterium]
MRSKAILISRVCAVWCVAVVLGMPALARGGIDQSLRNAIDTEFPPARPHRGLLTAQAAIEPQKVNTYVVLLRGGIPAGKAEFFITNQEYDYRASVIDVATESISTRRGKVYAYLPVGQVMLVAETKYSHRTVYLKLLSASVYEGRRLSEKHPSRVATMVGFTLPREMVTQRDRDAALAALTKWVRPFHSLDAAMAFAEELSSPQAAHSKSHGATTR